MKAQPGRRRKGGRADPASLPRPPGRGPALGGSRISTRIALIVGAVFILQLVVYTSFYAWSYGDPFDWIDEWPIWAIIVSWPVLQLLFWRGSTVSVGADWFMQNKRQWVATYELVSVNTTDESDGTPLTLQDRDGRQLTAELQVLYDEPWIWDYVYNGILHSVVEGGAEADAETRLELRLPPAPDVDPDPR